jgi:transposase
MSGSEDVAPATFTRDQLERLDKGELIRIVLDLSAQLLKVQADVRRLEARLDTHSGNSSTPPSMDGPKSKAEQKKARQEKRKKRKRGKRRKRGGQPGHVGHFRKKPDEVDHVKTILPSACFHCHAPLDEGSIAHTVEPVRHYTYELVEKPVEITETRCPVCLCPRCGGTSQAPLPPEVRRSTLGERLSALGLFLRGELQSSTRDVVEFFETVLDTPISLGTVSNVEGRFSAALERPYAEALDALKIAKMLNIDETTWYEESNRKVIWIATNGELTVYRIDASKGREALHKLIGVDFRGIIGSDRAKAYDGLNPARRQVCWSHLDRNYQKIYDKGKAGRRMAARALAEIDTLFGIWHSYKRGELDHKELAAKLLPVKHAFRTILDRGMTHADEDVKAISTALDGIWDALWTFTRHPGVEPTNNSAERDGRPPVTLRKTSLGSQSERGSRFITK